MSRQALVAAGMTAAVLALTWPAWIAAGWIVEVTGLGPLDILLRAVIMVVAFGLLGRLADPLAARLARRTPDTPEVDGP